MLRELRRVLPQTDFTYLGDAGRAPYGGRDVETVLDFAEQCVERLFEEGCRVVIVACHTVYANLDVWGFPSIYYFWFYRNPGFAGP